MKRGTVTALRETFLRASYLPLNLELLIRELAMCTAYVDCLCGLPMFLPS